MGINSRTLREQVTRRGQHQSLTRSLRGLKLSKFDEQGHVRNSKKQQDELEEVLRRKRPENGQVVPLTEVQRLTQGDEDTSDTHNRGRRV